MKRSRSTTPTNEKPPSTRATQSRSNSTLHAGSSSQSNTIVPAAKRSMAPACPHLAALLPTLAVPKPGVAVHRDECTLCFDDAEGEHGIDVCLTCFNGGCIGNGDREHARAHASKTWHALVCNVKRRRKAKEPEAAPTTLAIVAKRDEDDWTYETTAKCLACEPGEGRTLEKVGKLGEVIKGIMQSLSSAQQTEVQAWQQEIVPCAHTRELQQKPDARKVDNAGQCAQCDLTTNLWLCLTCGAVSCGRQQFGGLGGNGHAVGHFSETGHPVSVKQGTITAEGAADIFCYSCSDERADPDLAKHLKHLGISTLGLAKTEKSMTELQLEQNMKFDFNMTGEDGKDLEPLFGQGLTGLKNLGNSCYMASVLQTLFALPSFQARYLTAYRPHTAACTNPQPASCLECQMGKLADGLLSGRYSKPRPSDGNGPSFQEGIRPSMLKSLVGRGHAEFSTMRQQDADEFLKHLINCLQRDTRRLEVDASLAIEGAPTTDATRVFSFGLQQRLQCTECKRVRYTIEAQDAGLSLPVPLRPKHIEPAEQVVEETSAEEITHVVLPPAPAEDDMVTDVLPDPQPEEAAATEQTQLFQPPAQRSYSSIVASAPAADVSMTSEAPLEEKPVEGVASAEEKGKAPVEGVHADAQHSSSAVAPDASADTTSHVNSDTTAVPGANAWPTATLDADAWPAAGSESSGWSTQGVVGLTADDPIKIDVDEDAEKAAREEEEELQKAIAASLKTGGSLNQIEYEEVDLRECLDIFTAPEELEYHCPACAKTVIATKQTLFTSFPEVLAVQVRRFQLLNWVPQKVDVPISVPLDVLELDKYLGTGKRDDEEELPDPKEPEPAPKPAAAAAAGASSSADGAPALPPRSAVPEFNEAAINEVCELGFSRPFAQRAFLQVGLKSGSQAALEWIFNNMELPNRDEPINFEAEAADAAAVAGALQVEAVASSAAPVAQPAPDTSALEDMGFSRNQARKAMRIAGGNPEAAVAWLFENTDDPGEEEAPAEPVAADVEMADGTAGPSSEALDAHSGPVVVGGSATLPARFRLKAFISHKGPSIHSGHYVAHIRHGESILKNEAGASGSGAGAEEDEAWVLFNDEKVVKAPFSSASASTTGAQSDVGVKGLSKLAYEYIWERI